MPRQWPAGARRFDTQGSERQHGMGSLVWFFGATPHSRIFCRHPAETLVFYHGGRASHKNDGREEVLYVCISVITSVCIHVSRQLRNCASSSNGRCFNVLHPGGGGLPEKHALSWKKQLFLGRHDDIRVLSHASHRSRKSHIKCVL